MSAESPPAFDAGVDDRLLEDDGAVVRGQFEVVTPGNDPLEDEAGIDGLSDRERREAKKQEFDALRREVDQQ